MYFENVVLKYTWKIVHAWEAIVKGFKVTVNKIMLEGEDPAFLLRVFST